ncbi:unnamed protein product, partial [Rotaria sordida]
TDGYLCQCIQASSFGKNCEYQLPIGNTVEQTLDWYAYVKNKNPEEVHIHGDIVCYETLTCDSGLLCLDWREICDGVQQCMYGYDEENCDLLELNICTEGQYRCKNGMCIPDEYFLDGAFDCMDWSDEMQYKKSASCAMESASIQCDDHLCSPNEWSCGDGQCIPDRKTPTSDIPTCLSVMALGDQDIDCDNEFDESWFGTNRKLSAMNCNDRWKDECSLRQYIEQSWSSINHTANLLESRIRFPFFCDTFWHLESGKDEDINECRQWWICASNQWQCRTGQCIEKGWKADNIWDCADGSDEDNILKTMIVDGVLGPIKAYFGTVESQGRGSLHLHILIWLDHDLKPADMKEKIQNAGFREKLKAYLEDIIKEDLDEFKDKHIFENLDGLNQNASTSSICSTPMKQKFSPSTPYGSPSSPYGSPSIPYTSPSLRYASPSIPQASPSIAYASPLSNKLLQTPTYDLSTYDINLLHNKSNLIPACLPTPNPSSPNFASRFRADVVRLVEASNIHKHSDTCYKYSNANQDDKKSCRMRMPRKHGLKNKYNEEQYERK